MTLDYCEFFCVLEKSFWKADKPIFLHVGTDITFKRKVGMKWKESWGGAPYKVADYEDQIHGEGDYLFEIKKMYYDTPTKGWGCFLTRERFLKRFKVRIIQ